MVRASVASERARRGHKRASALGERAVPKNYPSERLNIVNNAYLLPNWLATKFRSSNMSKTSPMNRAGFVYP